MPLYHVWKECDDEDDARAVWGADPGSAAEDFAEAYENGAYGDCYANEAVRVCVRNTEPSCDEEAVVKIFEVTSETIVQYTAEEVE